MKKIILAFLVLIFSSCIGVASLFDLDDYILSTGNEYLTSNLAFANRNETTGDYVAMVSLGKDNELVLVSLYETNNITNFNEKNMTEANGYKPVKKPYRGYLKVNDSDDTVAYTGFVKENLSIFALFQSYQEAINMLPELKVISRKDYQKIKGEELAASLS